MLEHLIGETHNLLSELQPTSLRTTAKTVVIPILFVNIECVEVRSIVVMRLSAEGAAFYLVYIGTILILQLVCGEKRLYWSWGSFILERNSHTYKSVAGSSENCIFRLASKSLVEISMRLV